MMNRNANRTRRAGLTRRLSTLVAMIGGVLFAGTLAGCQEKKLVEIKGEAEFQRLVLESKQPVIVDFSKDNCPTCVPVESVLFEVSKEYEGRAKFYRFMLLDRFFRHYSPAISDAFGLQYVPTAVLFVNGEEKQRWSSNIFHDTYRNALDELVGAPPQTKPQPTWPLASSTGQ